MTTRIRRVYRAVAWYAAHDNDEHSISRNFLTKKSRDNWAAKRRAGYPAISPVFDDTRPAIPPALRVEVMDSDPVVFPAEGRQL